MNSNETQNLISVSEKCSKCVNTCSCNTKNIELKRILNAIEGREMHISFLDWAIWSFEEDLEKETNYFKKCEILNNIQIVENNKKIIKEFIFKANKYINEHKLQ